jgi:dTDP-4-amino-4,6-dideoxygalactose transaminase
MIAMTATGRRPARSFEWHESARGALQSYLRECRFERGEAILLPSYIGWSPREGSGIFDPIRELGLNFGFYRLDRALHIDMASVQEAVESSRAKVLLLVHYFGHVDPSYELAVRMARNAGLRVIEDEAHAMLSDLTGAVCGRLGDVCLYSLHKLLPVRSGGMLVRNGDPLAPGVSARSLWEHDLAVISASRRRNAIRLLQLLAEVRDDAEPLWDPPLDGEVPQTLPVRLLHADRDAVYHEMNGAGFGVVSLYHTLIEPISKSAFPESYRLARKILNLPVHQDILLEDLDALIACFKKSLSENRQ